MKKHILLINGPNLNLLGHREPHIYGSETLVDIVAHLDKVAQEHGVVLQHHQSNSEADIIECIHAARVSVGHIIINAGAYTHTSVAIRDALVGVAIPFVEVHLSNVHAREPFRHHSYLSDKAVGVVVGLGSYGYEAALRFCLRQM